MKYTEVQHFAMKDGTCLCGCAVYPGRFSIDDINSVTCIACRAAAGQEKK
jgi:hypothetical protein